MQDAWCPNCQQRVAPSRDPGWLPTLVGWANLVVLFVAVRLMPPAVREGVLSLFVDRLPYLFGDWIWTLVLVIAAEALCAWWVLRRLAMRATCPICRTVNLQASAPVAHG